MLLLGVGLLVSIDLTILVTYTIVQGVRGQLGPVLEENGENPIEIEGVSEITYRIALNFRVPKFSRIAIRE